MNALNSISAAHIQKKSVSCFVTATHVLLIFSLDSFNLCVCVLVDSLFQTAFVRRGCRADMVMGKTSLKSFVMDNFKIFD